VTVEHNHEDDRFEVTVDGKVAFTEYVLDGNTMRLVHTEVPEALDGQGLASKVVTAALDFARSEGLKVVAVCKYVIAYLKRHPEYNDIVVPDTRV
jgi:predicted GNAT family acetyltransferase